MKKVTTIIASLTVAAAMYAAPVIFVVDTNLVYQNYYKAVEASKQIQSSVEQTNQELQKMDERRQAVLKEIQAVQEKVNNPALAEDAKRKIAQDEGEPKVQELRSIETNIQSVRQQANQRLEQNIQSIRAVHINEIREAVGKIAEAKKADLIVDKSVCLYSKATDDITQEVIAAINAGAPTD